MSLVRPCVGLCKLDAITGLLPALRPNRGRRRKRRHTPDHQ